MTAGAAAGPVTVRPRRWLELAMLAFALAITIIGIPFAWQHVKLALLALTPVGKAVVEV